MSKQRPFWKIPPEARHFWTSSSISCRKDSGPALNWRSRAGPTQEGRSNRKTRWTRWTFSSCERKFKSSNKNIFLLQLLTKFFDRPPCLLCQKRCCRRKKLKGVDGLWNWEQLRQLNLIGVNCCKTKPHADIIDLYVCFNKIVSSHGNYFSYSSDEVIQARDIEPWGWIAWRKQSMSALAQEVTSSQNGSGKGSSRSKNDNIENNSTIRLHHMQGRTDNVDSVDIKYFLSWTIEPQARDLPRFEISNCVGPGAQSNKWQPPNWNPPKH